MTKDWTPSPPQASNEGQIFHNCHRAIIGETQSGKTHLMKWMVRNLSRYLIYDIKGIDVFHGYTVTSIDDLFDTWRNSKTGMNSKIVFKTQQEGRQHIKDEFNEICRLMFSVRKHRPHFRNFDIIIDEAAQIMPQGDPEIPEHLYTLMMQGLANKTRLWALSQRFQWIKKDFVANCGEVYFIGTNPYDLKYVSKFYDENLIRLIDGCKNYGFVRVSNFDNNWQGRRFLPVPAPIVAKKPDSLGHIAINPHMERL